MRHRDLTLLKRIRRPVGYDRTTVGGIDESVPRDDSRPPPDGPMTVYAIARSTLNHPVYDVLLFPQ